MDDEVFITLNLNLLLDILHTMTQSAKHMRRLQMVYVTCHKDCLCNGTCEHPDALKASELTDKLVKQGSTLSGYLNSGILNKLERK
jgi:hypothetical protein